MNYPQLSKGYRQTEVGVIPDEWEVQPFEKLAYIERGKFTARPRNDPKYYGGDIPFIQTGDVTNASGQITTFSQTLNSEGLKVSKLFPRGTLFFTIAANIGDVGFAAFDTACPDSLVAITPTKKINKVWLAYELAKRKKLFENTATINAQLNINLEKLRPYLLPVPPLPEQEAIAEALSDADALIKSLEQLIAKKRQIKQGAMQELLTGKRRLPGFRPLRLQFKQSHVGAIPDDWALVQLIELADPARSIRYGIVQPGDYDPRGRYMIRGQDYSEVKGWANPAEVFRVSPGIEERHSNARVKMGDLIMTIVGYCGHVEIIPKWLDGANLTQTTARIAIKPEKAVNTFCRYMLLSPAVKNQVSAYIKGAAQPGLNCGDIEKFLVPIPSLPEQTAIATILSDMDIEITALETKLTKARQIKQGMMHELLTGKVRLI